MAEWHEAPGADQVETYTISGLDPQRERTRGAYLNRYDRVLTKGSLRPTLVEVCALVVEDDALLRGVRPPPRNLSDHKAVIVDVELLPAPAGPQGPGSQ